MKPTEKHSGKFPRAAIAEFGDSEFRRALLLLCIALLELKSFCQPKETILEMLHRRARVGALPTRNDFTTTQSFFLNNRL
jgi:hypothetical protein